MIRKLRKIALWSGIGMHIGILVLMKDLVFFSFQMITFYVLFFNEEFSVQLERKIQNWQKTVWQKVTAGGPAKPA